MLWLLPDLYNLYRNIVIRALHVHFPSSLEAVIDPTLLDTKCKGIFLFIKNLATNGRENFCGAVSGTRRRN